MQHASSSTVLLVRYRATSTSSEDRERRAPALDPAAIRAGGANSISRVTKLATHCFKRFVWVLQANASTQSLEAFF